jgi:NAD(P)-dependent dehydrogenase (short-subunit alcohol dehydrogenase family)
MAFARYPSLEDKLVLITGGGSGIGAAMVEAFCGQDTRVAFIDIDDDASGRLVASLSAARHPPVYARCDLVDIAALQATLAGLRARLGGADVLVNNAANDERHAVDAVTPERWDHAQAVNLRHQFFAAQAVRAQMRERGGGSIINFSSIAWMGGGMNMVAYATAKAAVVGLTNSLANEFGDDFIRVNAIAPGAVVTERQRRLWLSEADIDGLVRRQALHRVLLAGEIARAALFLAADDSHMLTKQCIIVDGGLR